MCVVVGVGGHTGLTLVGMERWTPRTEQDKDLMLAKLVQDNETLMGEVQLCNMCRLHSSPPLCADHSHHTLLYHTPTMHRGVKADVHSGQWGALLASPG